MTTRRPLISVICCAHNEEKYVDKSMPNLLKALKGFPYEIIFVADRCTDNTVEQVRKYKVKIIKKVGGDGQIVMLNSCRPRAFCVVDLWNG